MLEYSELGWGHHASCCQSVWGLRDSVAVTRSYAAAHEQLDEHLEANDNRWL
jgi:hypothetical protein